MAGESLKKIVKRARKLAREYCVGDGEGFRLKDCDPGDTADLPKLVTMREEAEFRLGILLTPAERAGLRAVVDVVSGATHLIRDLYHL